MNKKILSIFALIMAISILGVSCSENPADPNNGGSGNPNLPTAQYPQTDLTKTQVAEIVKKLGTVKVNAAEANKTVEFVLGSEDMSADDPILGAYPANGVAMTTTSAPTKATIIGISDVVNAFNAVIKGEEYQKAVKEAIKDTDDKSLITKVNDATVHSADGVKIVLAITFVDSKNKNGVIALPLTITSGAVGSVPVDFGATTAEMPKVTDTDIKSIFATAFSGMKIGSTGTDVLENFEDTAVEVTPAAGATTINITSTKAVASGSLAAAKTAITTATTGVFAQLNSALATYGIKLEGTFSTKNGITGASKVLTIKPDSGEITVSRIAGSGYYYDGTDNTGLFADNKLIITITAGSGTWE